MHVKLHIRDALVLSELLGIGPDEIGNLKSESVVERCLCLTKLRTCILSSKVYCREKSGNPTFSQAILKPEEHRTIQKHCMPLSSRGES